MTGAHGIPEAGALRVVELFAGVGGFRLAFDRVGFATVFANQWEPGVKAQHAADVYRRRFGAQGPLFNVDVAQVPSSAVPDHDLLCGGFPCQDYSAATPNAAGMDGKKGILWWQIRRILEDKLPAWVVLENVDRLLVSPAKQRGRDFAVVLTCLRDLGYDVAWRVVNAAEWGVPQSRRRVFIVASRGGDPGDVMATAFGPEPQVVVEDIVEGRLDQVSASWGRRFFGAGVMQADGRFRMWKPAPVQAEPVPLADVLVPGEGREIGDVARWEYVKGAKDEPRTAKNGYQYRFREGALPFPDRLDRPARTILTSEGGRSANRSTHVVRDPQTRSLRTLRPVEVERLQGFPDGWTEGVPDGWRFKLMGNALAVPVAERIAWAIQEQGVPVEVGSVGRPRDPGSQDPRLEAGIPGAGVLVQQGLDAWEVGA